LTPPHRPPGADTSVLWLPPQVALINATNLMGQQLPRLTGDFIAELMQN
jgi:hypothetical protein